MKSGIYQIKNTKTKRVYVGSAVNILVRFRIHKKQLNSGVHANYRLQRAWVKYGCDAFSFDVLEYSSPEFLIEREQFYINKVFRRNSYNIAPIAASVKGLKWSKESKEKQSERCIGREMSAETRKKISEAQKGKIVSEETRKRMSVAFTGRTHSDKTKSIIGDKNRGREVSEETRKKISIAGTGRHVSDLTREKLSRNSIGNKSFLGRKHTEETKRKISEGNKGKIITEAQREATSKRLKGIKLEKFSEERRANMAAGARLRWQKYRESKIP